MQFSIKTLLVAQVVLLMNQSWAAESDSPMNKAELQNMISATQKELSPQYQKLGIKIKAKFNPKNQSLQAEVSYPSSPQAPWNIAFSQGLLSAKLDRDALQLVLCHEFGHILGGYPVVQFLADLALVAVEGQADYFATQACARKLWIKTTTPEQGAQARAKLPEQAQKDCDQTWSEPNQRNVCYRILAASVSLTNRFSQLMPPSENALPGEEHPSYGAVSKFRVTETYGDLNSPQCRLDTFAAGALCTRPFDFSKINATDQDALKSSCTTGIGARPACWFKSGDDHAE